MPTPRHAPRRRKAREEISSLLVVADQEGGELILTSQVTAETRTGTSGKAQKNHYAMGSMDHAQVSPKAVTTLVARLRALGHTVHVERQNDHARGTGKARQARITINTRPKRK